MSFTSVIGNASAVARLRAAIRNGRLAHGYIFAGPEGVGKTLIATEFAKAILCERGGDDACGECGSCRKFGHGNHPGFERMEPEGKGRVIRIEALRELQRGLAFGTRGAAHLIVVIEPADRMLPAVANAFLKTLEEPPAGIMLVLITAQPAALLETIVSRCQMVRFAPVPRADIEAFLMKQRGAAPDAARLAAAMSDGSPGRAIALLDGGLAAQRDDLLEKLQDLTPDNSPDLVEQLVRSIGKGSASSGDQRLAARGLLNLVLYIYRDMLSARMAGEDYPLHSADCRQAIASAAQRLDADDLLAAVDMLIEAIGQIDVNVNLEMLLDDLLGRIAEMNARSGGVRREA
jgi:DNA polymerase-3 subunit delta'